MYEKQNSSRALISRKRFIFINIIPHLGAKVFNIRLNVDMHISVIGLRNRLSLL